MVKQLSTADELFDSIKQIKKLFMNDMAVYSSGRVIQNAPADYVTALQGLYKVVNLIGLSVEHVEQNLSVLYEWSSQLKTQEDVFLFTEKFNQIVEAILLAIIQYREYYCIIKRNDDIPGLASHIITNLGQIAASLDEGYIPVIDMVNVDNSFSDLSRKMKQNAWELFFQQPFNVSVLSGAEGNKCIVKDEIPPIMPNYDMNFLTNSYLVGRWKRLMKMYMPFSSAMVEKIETTIRNTPFSTGERILGVLCRGTDYTITRPYNHPVQPTIAEVLAKAEEVMEQYTCKYIYLATEDSAILSCFQKKFQDSLFSTQNIYYSDVKEDSLTAINKKHNIDVWAKNQEYLTALYLLGQCCCFIGGRTSGTVVSLLLSEKYDYFYVWNKGRYGIDDVFAGLV